MITSLNAIERAREIGTSYADKVHAERNGSLLELLTRLGELERRPDYPSTDKATAAFVALTAFDIRTGELERA
jgi:hypothetical protein